MNRKGINVSPGLPVESFRDIIYVMVRLLTAARVEKKSGNPFLREGIVIAVSGIGAPAEGSECK